MNLFTSSIVGCPLKLTLNTYPANVLYTASGFFNFFTMNGTYWLYSPTNVGTVGFRLYGEIPSAGPAIVTTDFSISMYEDCTSVTRTFT